MKQASWDQFNQAEVAYNQARSKRTELQAEIERLHTGLYRDQEEWGEYADKVANWGMPDDTRPMHKVAASMQAQREQLTKLHNDFFVVRSQEATAKALRDQVIQQLRDEAMQEQEQDEPGDCPDCGAVGSYEDGTCTQCS